METETGTPLPSSAPDLDPAKLTPVMRQYVSVKGEYPHAIVLFRLGDFFETFFQDAIDCARLLDLTLTTRSKEKDIPMAGVPHHAKDGYISRLIELGRTVVLVDQVEDPKLAKGLVRREVTEILSPGTFLDPNAPPRAATYLVALVLPEPKRGKRGAKEGFGLAALDLSTGELRATSGEGEELLLDELGRLGMREVVFADSLASDERLARVRSACTRTAFTPLASRCFEARVAREALERRFGADEARGLSAVLSPDAVSAAGAALAFVEETQAKPTPGRVRREPLRHVVELKPYLPGEALVLDQEARAHLELFRAAGDGGRRGSLIGALDEAVTAMGGRLLSRWLAYPSRSLEVIHERQDALAALIAAPAALDRLRESLAAVGDLERLTGRVVLGRATPRDLATLRATLDRAPAILGEAARLGRGEPGSEGPEPSFTELAGTSPAGPQSGLLARLSLADACVDLAARLQAALVEDPPVDLEADQIFRVGFDEELDRLTSLARNGKSLIGAMEAEEREKTGISSLKIRFNRVFGYFIEVTKPNLKLVPDRYIRKQTTASGERFFTDALRDLETEVLEADERLSTRIHELFGALVEEVARETRRLARLAEALAVIDVLAGLARVAERRSWCRPEVAADGVIEIGDGRHPVLEALATELGERFVPNDLSIAPDRSLMIITGPNMAGKSTIMRQTALIVILAHMGAYVPARVAHVALTDRVFTRVGASDDLSRGRSTFMVEMNETARILRAATKDSLILLDEIGRGTSTFDGLSIAWAVAEHLHDVIGAKTLFATHYHELTELCRDKPRAVNHHVAVKEWNEQIVFLRKLLPGPTNRSYGVQVARLAGLPRPVIERAREVLASLEAQALAAGDGSAVAHLARAREAAGGQLFLFGAPPRAPAPATTPPPANGEAAVQPRAAPDATQVAVEAATQELLEALAAAPPEDLTPRQALERLFELHEILRRVRKR